MPPFNFYRRRWYPNRWRRRKRYFRRRRFGPLIRRRFRRRRWVRRRRFHRKYKRKLSKIRLNEWQPQTIKKCRIKGNLCLLTCGRGRINHNYVLTSESYVPTSEPGGGSWSIMQLTLRVLYDEYKAGRNWWTASNTLLPLCRYIKCNLKFYRSATTDYIVHIQRTGPFEVTLESYLATQPTRFLMNRRAFIVPKLGRGPNKRTYIRKTVLPPALLMNKWYFSQDLYNTPLFIITTAALSLDQMFAPEDQISTNITLYSLNTIAIQISNWENIPYSTKAVGTIPIYLWSYGHGQTQPESDEQKWKNIIPLLNTKEYTEGEHINKGGNQWSDFKDITEPRNKQKWGNPFTHWYQDKDTPIYYGTPPKPTNNTKPAQIPSILPIESLYVECRYNPFKDKGTGNKLYWLPTDTGLHSFMSEPTDEKLIVRDLPLWLVLWGWGDWILKSKPITHIQEEWQLVIKSPYIYPTMPAYVFVDKYFRDPPEGELWKGELTETDKKHWHIKYEMQQEELESIAKTGPAAPKLNKTKQIECHLHYQFHFKWGGCPAPMETITDPAQQEKFPTPNNQLQGIEITSPGQPKEYQLYTFDEKRNTITHKAAKRLKTDFTTPKFFTDFGAKDIPQKAQTSSEDSSEEEEIQTSFQREEQLKLQLKRKRQQYRHRIQQLLKTKKLFPL
nr:MAG: ORF1 [TTV-like mini virus]